MIAILALVVAIGRPKDAWFGADKLKHFFTAAVVQSLSYGALRATGVEHRTALRGAWGATTIASIGKEIRDRRVSGLFSVRDLVWDAAGAALATTMLNHSQRTEPDTNHSRVGPRIGARFPIPGVASIFPSPSDPRP
jgi:uncharacterized protein YfiM (DUF2279 family)